MELHFNFVVFDRLVWQKNEIFAQTLLHTVKQWNKMGMVETFLYSWVLTVYNTYLTKIINVTLNLPKLL